MFNQDEAYVEYLVMFLEDKLGKPLNIVNCTITPEGECILFDGDGKDYRCSFA
jgi:hypothetical protein